MKRAAHVPRAREGPASSSTPGDARHSRPPSGAWGVVQRLRGDAAGPRMLQAPTSVKVPPMSMASRAGPRPDPPCATFLPARAPLRATTRIRRGYKRGASRDKRGGAHRGFRGKPKRGRPATSTFRLRSPLDRDNSEEHARPVGLVDPALGGRGEPQRYRSARTQRQAGMRPRMRLEASVWVDVGAPPRAKAIEQPAR